MGDEDSGRPEDGLKGGTWHNRYCFVLAQFREFCQHYRMCVGKEPVDALPKRTIMKIVVVAAFESRCDRKFGRGKDEVACTVKSSRAI